MISPVAPECEVDQKNKDKHDELEAFPSLTDIADFRHVHILEKEDASENSKDRGKLPQDVHLVEPRVNIGLLVVWEMPPNEECQYANIAFHAIFWAWKECCCENEYVLSDIHNYNLPKEAVIVQAYIEDAINLKSLVLSESASAFPYLEEDNKRKEDAPDQDQGETNRELQD